MLQQPLVRDGHQDRREQRESAADALPPDTKRAAHAADELRSRIAARVGIRDRELQIDTEEPLAGCRADRRHEQRLDRHERSGNENRRDERMREPACRRIRDDADRAQLRQQ
jgi:hypothetical protein